MITFRLLGCVDLRGHREELLHAALAQPKRLALLAYLVAATPRAFHSRDTLLALLWAELDQQHARAALRQALYVLRGVLGDEVLVTCGDAVIGVEHRRVWSDVTALDRAVKEGDPAEVLTLYGGELLPGFHISAAPEFERWLDGERARLAAHAAAAAWALVDRDEGRGDLSAAVEWGRRLLAISPGDERALRKIVELLTELGDRAAAIEAYRQFAQRLETDYEMGPAPETQALIAAIRSRLPHAGSTTTPLLVVGPIAGVTVSNLLALCGT
jgi:serine/threonine-protein kinase